MKTISITLFFLLSIRLLCRDFYYDEIYSLVHYILVPIRQTVFEYKNLNNHFFFSAICNGYMKLFGQNLHWLMDRPYVIRLPQLIPVGITFYYLHKISVKFFNRQVATYSIVILCTTLPYYYYTTQIRGYNLSIMFMTILIYKVWSK